MEFSSNLFFICYISFLKLKFNITLVFTLLGGIESGVLVPPPTSPTAVNNRPSQGSHSAQASPTSTMKAVRPRARSADESVSKQKVSIIFIILVLEYVVMTGTI